MPSFNNALKKSRNKQRTSKAETNARFKQILDIVRGYDLRDGMTPEKAVNLLQDLGPTFVKLGQIASTHPDMLPTEYCDAFASLRADVRPMDFATVRAQVETELGAPIDQLFSTFDEEPVGSASIGQVHGAVVAGSGKEVAVKVQRPGIVETTADDFAILERAVDLYGLVNKKSDGDVSMKELLEELEQTSSQEMDFSIEASNLQRFYANNEGRTGVTSPRCYAELSTSAILTEDFMPEPRIGDEGVLSQLTDDERERLGYLIADNYCAQMLQDGFFHADPHAGNILLTTTAPEETTTDGEAAEPEGDQTAADGQNTPDGQQAPSHGIAWIDFGMMGQLTSKEREEVMDLASALVRGDAYALSKAVQSVAHPTGPVNTGELIALCERMTSQYADTDLESFDTGSLANQLMGSMTDAGWKLEPFLANLGRGLVTLEGTIALVSPKVNIMQVLTTYLTESLSPKKVASKVRGVALQGVESAAAMAGLPAKASDTLDMLQKGELGMSLNAGVSSPTMATVTRLVKWILLTLMAVGLFLGSSILCLTDLEPTVAGVPALGFVGFVCGIALMVYVLVQVRKN